MDQGELHSPELEMVEQSLRQARETLDKIEQQVARIGWVEPNKVKVARRTPGVPSTPVPAG